MKQFLYAIHQHSEKRSDIHCKVTFGLSIEVCISWELPDNVCSFYPISSSPESVKEERVPTGDSYGAPDREVVEIKWHVEISWNNGFTMEVNRYSRYSKLGERSMIWACSWDYGTYHIGEQRRLRRACASAHSRQSLRCSHTWSMEVDEGSDKKSDV